MEETYTPFITVRDYAERHMARLKEKMKDGGIPTSIFINTDTSHPVTGTLVVRPRIDFNEATDGVTTFPWEHQGLLLTNNGEWMTCYKHFLRPVRFLKSVKLVVEWSEAELRYCAHPFLLHRKIKQLVGEPVPA